MGLSLTIPAFIAGLLTFLAPCTLPLVPAYLGFISGVSNEELQDPSRRTRARVHVFVNGVLYVVGFSFVFIALGLLFGLGGAALGPYQAWLSRIGGIFVILFGLYLLQIVKLPFLNVAKRMPIPSWLKPGQPTSALMFGAIFALGWTPCVGPVLGSILLLASSSATALQGGWLLFIFSLGLGIPFLLIALGIGHAAQYVKKLTRFMNVVSVIGGIFLIFLGVLLVTDNMAVWLSEAYRLFQFLHYEDLLQYL